MNQLKELRRKATSEIIKHFNEKRQALEQTPEKTTAKIRGLELQRSNAIKAKIAEIEAVEKAEPFKGQLIITVEWKRSRMWGSNPKSYTNFGFESDSIGGCGYDKLSTATAEALNNHKPLLKLLWQAKEKYLATHPRTKKGNSDIHREILGYGAGYGLLPRFEGGVGVGSHQRIIEKLGLQWQNVTSTNNTDVFIISAKGATQ